MSSTYSGVDTFPATVTLPDDGDAADAASVDAPMEGLADRTIFLLNQRRRPVLQALGSIPFFTAGAFDQVGYSGLITSGSVGAAAFFPLALDHDATVTIVEVRFIPAGAGGRGGNLPGTPPSIQVLEWPVTVGGGAPSSATLGTEPYVPVNYANYINGNVKKISMETPFTVDAVNNIYQLVVIDESGSDSVVGNIYIDVAVTY